MAIESKHDRGIMRQLLGQALQNRLSQRQRARRRKRAEQQGDNRPGGALIFGVGAEPGIGAAIAHRAAAGGLTAFVAGRSEEKLQATAENIRQAGGKAQAFVMDVTEPEQITGAFEAVKDDGHRLDLVVHNVGTNRPCGFLDIQPEWLEKSWAADCRSGFLVGQKAIETMLEQTDSERGRGTLLFTGASASLRGKAGCASFAQAKAGLRMLAQALAREYGPEGIHVAHVIIDGAVNGARLQSALPDFIADLGDDGTLDPAAIAESYWALHQQHKSAWTQEMDLRPFKENW